MENKKKLIFIIFFSILVAIFLDEDIYSFTVRMPGEITAEDTFKYRRTTRGVGDGAEWLSAEIGYAIIAGLTIVGTFLIGSGLYKRAQADQPHDARGSLIKISVGSALIVFALVVGVVIKTMNDNIQ